MTGTSSSGDHISESKFDRGGMGALQAGLPVLRRDRYRSRSVLGSH